MISFLLAFILGGIGRRVAGGAFQEWTGLDVGDYPARAFWGFTCALMPFMHSAAFTGLMTLAIFLGCATPIHFRNVFGLTFGGVCNGREGNSALDDVVGLTLHGIGNMALASLLLWWIGGVWWLPLLAGATIAGWYEIGWRIFGLLPGNRWPVGFRAGSAWGEFIWGGACALAILLGW